MRLPTRRAYKTKNEYAYYQNKKLKSEHIGSVKMGDILPEVGQDDHKMSITRAHPLLH